MSRILPNKPNLQHLKNEAKTLAKSHDNKEPDVCETLRLLNRFSRASDQEILDSELSLNEAQYALAMDYGFKSWNDLKRHVANKSLPGKEMVLVKFWRKFGVLLNLGMPILNVLDIIEKEISDPGFKPVVAAIRSRIRLGGSISETLDEFPVYFSTSFPSIVKIGEEKGNLDEIFQKIADGLENGTFEAETVVSLAGAAPESPAKTEDKNTMQLLDAILLDAVCQKARDVRIERLNNKMSIRFRIGSVTKEITPPPGKMQGAVISRIKILSGLNTMEKRLPQDGRILTSVNGKRVDFRISVVPDINGESVTIRPNLKPPKKRAGAKNQKG